MGKRYTLTDQDWSDISALSLTNHIGIAHHCVGTNEGSYSAARRLAENQLVLIENSAAGPMVTRTYKCTLAMTNN